MTLLQSYRRKIGGLPSACVREAGSMGVTAGSWRSLSSTLTDQGRAPRELWGDAGMPLLSSRFIPASMQNEELVIQREDYKCS